jgi:hypothetical protein
MNEMLQLPQRTWMPCHAQSGLTAESFVKAKRTVSQDMKCPQCLLRGMHGPAKSLTPSA